MLALYATTSATGLTGARPTLALMPPPQGDTIAYHDTSASRIVRLNIPRHVCAGSRHTLDFGFNNNYSVVITNGNFSLGHNSRIFLPDGVSCPPNGCSYISPVTFTDFAEGATVTSEQDILYLRLNIEHSFIGDLYISISCPNGQQADILRYGGTGTSDCLDSITAEHRGWDNTLLNIPRGTDLGLSEYDVSINICDSLDYDNRPGTGWNYCWSDNTNMNYSYRAGDGRIYRAGNQSNYTVDSSNVAAGTQFYHPDDNFSNLIGCPLNGTWQVKVMDGWGGDNGWIFNWELALNYDMIAPDTCLIDTCLIVGDYITRIDNTSFLLDIPDSITSDTTLTYYIRFTNICGVEQDTTYTIHVHPNVSSTDTVVSCDYFMFPDQTYVTVSVDTLLLLHNIYSCDSLLDMNITIHNSSFTPIDTTLVENDLPFVIEGDTLPLTYNTINNDYLDTYAQYNYTDTHGCDSIIQFHLTVYVNKNTYTNSTVCESEMPLYWNGLTIGLDQADYDSYEHTSHIDTVALQHTHWGSDSVIYLFLTILHNDTVGVERSVCEYDMPTEWNGLTLTLDQATNTEPRGIDTSVILQNHLGCDSLVILRLNIITPNTIDRYDTITENQLPWQFHETLYTNDTDTTLRTSDPLTDVCDSIIRYHLKIFYNSEDTVYYYACPGDLPVQYGDSLFYQEGEGTFLLPGSHGEDSLVTFILHVIPHVIPSSDTTICDSITEDQLPWFAMDTVFNDTVADYIFHTYNEAGCDSIIHYCLYIFWNGDHCDTTLEFSNLVTPNGDGVNDRFVIGGLIEHNCFRYNELTIYDRTGHCVYHKRNIANESDWWDPAANRIPAGTYFYYFKAHGINIHTQHRGVIEVLRDK